jgi:anthranilate phosphoribosyltransferase
MRDLIAKILDGDRLTEEEAGRLLTGLTSDDLDPAMAAAVLAGMRTRGETAEEMRAFARGLQEIAVAPAIADVSRAVDVVGTGGDSSGSLNLSTGAALLAAAAGVEVIKHGNRSVSSLSVSFDVLGALGHDVHWDAERSGEVFEETGFTYLFAPAFHPSMRAIAPVRQSMGTRTIFNLVGPLANPARAPYLVVGAFSVECAGMMAETLAGMDITRAFVIHGEPGWDEPTPVGPYLMFDVSPGSVERFVEDPADFGIERCVPDALIGGDAAYNANAIREVFAGEPGPHRDALVLGASLALRIRGDSIAEAMGAASAAIDDGTALDLVDTLAATQETAGV